MASHASSQSFGHGRVGLGRRAARWSRATGQPWSDHEAQGGLSGALAAYRPAASGRLVAGKQARLLEAQRLGVGVGCAAAFLPGFGRP
ncbi:MAG: hypothetical protein ABI895_11495 [Deltaproteobacteria bacterium]